MPIPDRTLQQELNAHLTRVIDEVVRGGVERAAANLQAQTQTQTGAQPNADADATQRVDIETRRAGPLTWDVYSDIETRAHAAGLATDRLGRRAPSFFRFTGSGAGVARDTVGTGFKKAKPLPLPD
jgi:hypothetical protein